MFKKLSYKAKKMLIMTGIVAILVSILTGFAAIGAANGIANLGKNTIGDPNWSTIWAVIMLYSTGIMDILIGFGGVILGGIWAVSRLQKD